MENKSSSIVTLPGAIIIAAAIIAIAIIWVNKPAGPAQNSATVESYSETINLPPVTPDDHILGNPNAAIKIVEYSDPSCAYCKLFNATMTEIMEQYGPEGKIAWIYRHYPLNQPDDEGRVFHPNSGREAQALECAAKLGGNEKFWAYEKLFYETTPAVTSQTPNGLDPKQLPIIAKAVGLNTDAFNKCLDSEEHRTKIDSQARKASEAGVSGTPTTFFVLQEESSQKAADYIESALMKYRVPPDLVYMSQDRKIIAMNGAMPKAMILGLLETLLQ